MTDMYTHQIEIYTSSLLIGGSYDLQIYQRTSNAINGDQRRYLPLRDATIAPLERVQQSQRVPHLLVDRAEALLIATVEEAAPPSSYVRDEQVRGLVPVGAVFFTGVFVVKATFHKRPDLSLTEALERITDDFVSLTQVQVFPLVGGFAPVMREFAGLSRARIVALYQLGESTTSNPPSEPRPLAHTSEPQVAAGAE